MGAVGSRWAPTVNGRYREQGMGGGGGCGGVPVPLMPAMFPAGAQLRGPAEVAAAASACRYRGPARAQRVSGRP